MNYKIILSVLSVVLLVFVASLAAIELGNEKKVPAENINPVVNTTEEPKPTCFIGGCSGELCTGQSDAISTCIYKEEYACYQIAKCERQQDGQCGWTQTIELTSCLMGK